MYGQGQSSTSLFTKLKEAIVRGDKVFNMSGGEQLRDYLPVGEIARQIVRLDGLTNFKRFLRMGAVCEYLLSVKILVSIILLLRSKA